MGTFWLNFHGYILTITNHAEPPMDYTEAILFSLTKKWHNFNYQLNDTYVSGGDETLMQQDIVFFIYPNLNSYT